MKSAHTFSILFWINKSKTKDGKAPIYARITVEGKRSEISLKRSIEPDNWNAEKGLVKGNKEDSRMINSYIGEVRNQLFESYQNLQKQKKFITAELIKANYLGSGDNEHTLIRVFEDHNANHNGNLSANSIRNYKNTLNYVKLYLKEIMFTSDCYLSQLNYKWLVDFEVFLKNRHPYEHRRPCLQNSAMKHISLFRKVINDAIKNEWLDKDPFAKYKYVYDKTERQFLSAEELNSIESKVIKIERLRYTQDGFVFCCYTGLSFSDVQNLSPSNISIGIDGKYWLLTSRQKTGVPVRVPLLAKPLEIIEKYKNNPWCQNKNRVLPIPSNSKINSYLKEIADICGIEKNLTFHMSRHTFATIITLTNGVPIESVSSMLGHTSIKTTQIYAKVIQQKISEDMEALREKLEGNPKKPLSKIN